MAAYGHFFLVLHVVLAAYSGRLEAAMMESVCYDDAATLNDVGVTEGVSLGDHRGKAVLVVNTASFCTFTHQYLYLNKLQDKFSEKLVILAFPCNQFGKQEPGVGQEILNTLRYVRPGNGYVPNFYLHHQKIDVNGPKAHLLFERLKSSCPPVKVDIGDSSDLFWSQIQVGDITWNFNKFLLDKEGVPFKRYDSTVEPFQLVLDIELVLAGNHHDYGVVRPSRPQYLRREL